MKTDSRFDSFCTERECLNQKNSFFCFASQSIHISEDHEVRGIVQPTFSRFIKAEHGKVSDLEPIVSLICSAADQAIAQISTILRTNLFSKYIEYAQQLVKSVGNIDINSFTKGMSEGNYDFLYSFLEFQKGNQGVKNQKEKLESIMSSLLKRKIELISYTVNYSQTYSNNLERIIDQDKREAKMMKEEIWNKKNYQEDEKKKNQIIANQKPCIPFVQQKHDQQVSSHPKQIIENMMKVKVEEQISLHKVYELFKKDRVEPEIQNKEIQIEEDNYSEQDQKSQKQGVDKTKLIEKADKEKKKRQRRPFVENIIEILPNQIGIYEMYSDCSTIKKIQSLCPKVKAVHFFDRSLKSSKTIKIIINKFWTIEEISFEGVIPTRILADLPVELMMEKVKKIYLDGNEFTFHEDHFIRLYSTGYGLEHFNSQLYKTQIWNEKFKQLFSKLTKNQYLQLLKKFVKEDGYIKSRINCKITSLKMFIDCMQNQEINKLQNLEQLYLSYESNKQSYSLNLFENFMTFFKKNRSLKVVFLYLLGSHIDDSIFDKQNELGQQRRFPSISTQTIQKRNQIKNKIFSELSKLPYLQVLTISESTQREPCYLLIPNFKNLTHLYLDSIYFGKNQPDNFLSQLTHLKFLSLYECRDVETKHLRYLPCSSLETITFLNLGLTKIDAGCFFIIAKMKNLTHLFLKDVPLKGKQLIRMCKIYQNRFHQAHPLKMLNLEKNDRNQKTIFQEIISNYQYSNSQRLDSQFQSLLQKQKKQVYDKHKQICKTFTQEQQLTVEDKVWNLSLKKHLDQLLRYFTNNGYYYWGQKELLDLKKKSETWFQEKMRLNLLTSDNIPQINSCFPNLTYLNVKGHLNVVTANWKEFSQIKTIQRNKSLQKYSFPETEEMIRLIFAKQIKKKKTSEKNECQHM